MRLSRRKRTWYTVLSYRDETGKWRQKWETTGTASRERAESILADKRAQMRAGIRLEQDPTMAQWLRAWLDDVTSPHALRALAPNTAVEYRRICEADIIPALGATKLRELLPMDVQRMMTALLARGLSRSTVRYRYAILRAALHEAERQGLILRNAAALARRPQPNAAPQKRLRAEETRRLVALNADDPWSIYAELVLVAGLRLGELLGLHWEDIDWDERALRVERQRQRVKQVGVVERALKSAAGVRAVALPPRTLQTLREVRDLQERESAIVGVPPPDHVFCRRVAGQWRAWSPEAASAHVRKLYERAELVRPPRPSHSLRHTHLSAVSSAGMPVRDAQLRAGHSDPSTTLAIYMHSDVEGQRPAAARAADQLLPPQQGQPAPPGSAPAPDEPEDSAAPRGEPL